MPSTRTKSKSSWHARRFVVARAAANAACRPISRKGGLVAFGPPGCSLGVPNACAHSPVEFRILVHCVILIFDMHLRPPPPEFPRPPPFWIKPQITSALGGRRMGAARVWRREGRGGAGALCLQGGGPNPQLRTAQAPPLGVHPPRS